jgi:DNA polymerase I-like protein with 3'-5' exonuclease and polymerase domains
LASAIYSAAFQLQAANMRAAANHVIQSTGAQITKKVQRDIWDIQPAGVHEWIVQPCNVHDEIICVVSNKYPFAKGLVKGVVDRSVEGFRGKIPLIKLEWKQGLSWADK